MVRGGQLKTPFFMSSDYLDVGYAYPWIRPPVQTYSDVRFDAFQGIDTVFNHTVGDWEGTLQFYFGRLQDKLETPRGPIRRDIDTMIGATWSMTYNYMLTLRGIFHTARFTSYLPDEVNNLLTGLTNAGYGDVAEGLAINNEAANYMGFGASLDLSEWLLTSEYTRFDIDQQALISDDHTFFMTLGYRSGRVLYHITYDYKKIKPDYTIGDSIPTVSPITDPTLSGLRRGAYSAIGSETQTSDYTIGARIDFATNTAFKVELTQFNVKTKPHQYNGTAGSHLNGLLLSTAIDVVF